MRPKLAPRTAMGLMWHTDMNWSHVLWWLRGFRGLIFSIGSRVWSVYKGRPYPQSHSFSQPGLFWWFLSATTMLLFVSIPLSGLTMELHDAFVLSTEQATIYGPDPATLNNKGYIQLNEQVRANWRSGRPTAPQGGTILYAPAGTTNVSTTYYDNKIRSHAKNAMIQVFAGPAVEEIVHGNAWGLQTNITCYQAGKEDLKLIMVTDTNNHTFYAYDTSDQSRVTRWINETGYYRRYAGYSLLAATGTRPGAVATALASTIMSTSTPPLQYFSSRHSSGRGLGALTTTSSKRTCYDPNLISLPSTMSPTLAKRRRDPGK